MSLLFLSYNLVVWEIARLIVTYCGGHQWAASIIPRGRRPIFVVTVRRESKRIIIIRQ